jgi:MtrB/PioB family decaheme-associated outer membrane protein
MTTVRSLRAALAASVCLLPLQALAQSDDSLNIGNKPASAAQAPEPTNWITLGGQYNSGGSDYLNRFTGASSPGFYGLGDFHVAGRDAWDSGGTRYWSMDGKDMGFQDRSFILKFGEQGTWGVTLSYDGIPYEASDDFHSVWESSGGTAVSPGSLPLNHYPNPAQFPAVTAFNKPYVINGTVLPAIFFPTPSASLAGNLFDSSLALQRDIFTGTGKYQWNDWTITGSFRHEHKTGYQANSLEIGGTVGLTGTGTGASKNSPPTAGLTSGLGYFAQPIDYDTDRYDLTAAYSTQRFQIQLGYMFSNFTDNLAEFNAQNPFALGAINSSGSFTGTGATPGGISAPYSLPPSNTAQQVRLMTGYNLNPTTRVNANFAYGLQMQSAPYVSGTGDPGVNPYEPRSSFDGLVETFFGNVAVVTQPLPKLDFRLSYTIDDRDNRSSSNDYSVDTRSGAALNGGGDCGYPGGLCLNLPYSFEHQTITGEVGYRIFPQTKLTLNDTFETTYRNYADASFVTSNTVTAKVRTQLADDVFGALSVSHQDRNANNYANGNTWMLMTNGGVNPDTPPAFLMYFEASRKHDEVKGTLDWSPIHSLNTTLMVRLANDTYPDTQNGLRNNFNFEIGPDVSWDILPNLTTHAFYTFQQIHYVQSSVYSSGTNLSATGTGYYVPWTNTSNDVVHTVGVTADWKAIPDVLKISFNYNFSYGDTGYALGDGMAVIGGGQTTQTTPAALTLQNLPDVTSMLNMISIRGEYTLRPNWTVIFGYAFERFSYKDFMNGQSSTEYANALLPGTLNPNDSIHVIGAGLRVRF